MEGLREEVEDLLWSAQVVEDDVIRQDVERLDQLGSLGCRDAEGCCRGLCEQTTRTSVALDTNVLHCIFGWSLNTISVQETPKTATAGMSCDQAGQL